MTDTEGIDQESKRIISELYERLGSTNHYEILGVGLDADRRVIRAKYHELVNRFHPDRFFGRNLGAFKTKLERVFQRMTEAHEVLSRAESRAEYDAYLQRDQRTRALDRTLHDEAAQAVELRAVQAGIEAEARTKSSPQIPAARSEAPQVEAARMEAPNMDADARRRALARKLGRFQSTPPPQDTPPPISAPRAASSPNLSPSDRPRPRFQSSENISATHQRAAQELRGRYERHLMEARSNKLRDYQVRAEEALKSGNLFEAVNALRIAASLAPDNSELKRRLSELETRANEELANRYIEQAEYEQREQRYEDAVRSYQKAQKNRQLTPKQRERLVICLLHEGTDIRAAIENARALVLESPGEPSFRVTLARTYLAANMRESAHGELERAAALAPKDDSIKDLIRRVRRGEV